MNRQIRNNAQVVKKMLENISKIDGSNDILDSISYLSEHCNYISQNNINKLSTNILFNKHCEIVIKFISDTLKSLEYKE